MPHRVGVAPEIVRETRAAAPHVLVPAQRELDAVPVLQATLQVVHRPGEPPADVPGVQQVAGGTCRARGRVEDDQPAAGARRLLERRTAPDGKPRLRVEQVRALARRSGGGGDRRQRPTAIAAEAAATARVRRGGQTRGHGVAGPLRAHPVAAEQRAQLPGARGPPRQRARLREDPHARQRHQRRATQARLQVPALLVLGVDGVAFPRPHRGPPQQEALRVLAVLVPLELALGHHQAHQVEVGARSRPRVRQGADDRRDRKEELHQV